MRTRALLLLAGIAIICLFATGVATAAEPQEPSWGSETVDGASVETGFLPGGYFVVGTGDAGDTQTITGQAGPATGTGPCQISGGDADLILLHETSGCVQALDTSGSETGREGVEDLATARNGTRVIVALNPASQTGGIDENLAAWDLEDGSLSLAYRAQMQGTPLQVETDPNGLRTVVAVEDGSVYRVTQIDEAGNRAKVLPAKDTITALAISDDSRWAAVGGFSPQGGTSFGFVQLYDLTRARSDNPILTRTFERDASSVSDVQVTNGGRILASTEDGAVNVVSQHASDGIIDLGDSTPRLAANADASIVVAVTDDEVTRIGGLPSDLSIRWNQTLEASFSSVLLQEPYVYAFGDQIQGISADGKPLWSTIGGAAVAANQTGRTLAIASGGSSDDTGVTTSTVTVRSLVANATLKQAIQVGNQTTGNETGNQTLQPPTIAPDATGIVNMTIQNTGSAILDASLAPTNATNAVKIEFFPANFTIVPGVNRTIQASVTIAPNTPPQRIVIGLETMSTPAVNATGTLSVEVGQAPELTVRLEPGTLAKRAVTQRQNLSLFLELRNTGNTEAMPQLSVTQTPTRGGAWPVKLNPSTGMTIPPGAATSIRMDVRIPGAVPNGTTNQLIVEANASNATATTSVTFDVNRFQVLQIRPESTTKTMAPGATQAYTYRLSNLGSIPANVTLDATPIIGDGTPVPPGEWGMVLNRSNLHLADGQSTTFTLELTAPPDLETQDTLRVRVLAMTGQGIQSSASAFGVGDPALADREPNEEPLDPLVGITGLSLAALISRRLTHGKH